MTAPLTLQLGTFVATARHADIPADVLARVKVCLLHNLSVALAGHRAERFAHGLAARAYAWPREATLFFDGSRVSIEGAALANAALMHARTQDDYHSPSSAHPGGSLMPAAIALAEAQGNSGRDLLTAMILGYEVAGRIGRQFDKPATARGFRPAPIYGVFGAAAACARLLSLPARGVADAIGYAANLSAGLGQTWVEGASEWRFHLGIAARNGVFAARIAATGAHAAPHSLEGRAGFFNAVSGTLDPAPGVVSALGKDWQLRAVTQKRFPLCALLQGPVEMMLALADGEGLRPEAVSRITLSLSPFEAGYPGINSRGPFTDQGGTLMSAQYCLSLALVDRRATLAGLLRFNDDTIRAMMDKVHVEADPARGLLSSRLVVHTRDGRTLERDTRTAPTRNSFDYEETAALVHAMRPEMSVSARTLDGLVDTIADLEGERDLERLLRCFKPARGARKRGPSKRTQPKRASIKRTSIKPTSIKPTSIKPTSIKPTSIKRAAAAKRRAAKPALAKRRRPAAAKAAAARKTTSSRQR